MERMRNDSDRITGYSLDREICESANFWVSGECMNSPLSPIRSKDGQRLIVHKYDGVFYPFADIDKVRGKVCCIEYEARGMKYFAVKEIVGVDELANTLKLMYYNPKKTIVQLNVDAIRQLWLVDGVITENK